MNPLILPPVLTGKITILFGLSSVIDYKEDMATFTASVKFFFLFLRNAKVAGIDEISTYMVGIMLY